VSKCITNLNYGTFPIEAGYTDCDGVYCRTTGYRHPAFKSAAVSADVFRKAIRLTAAELLADKEFRALARKAAEKGKRFTADLLEWEKKDVVTEAVAVVRAEVEAERAEAARVAAEAEAARQVKVANESPVRDAVDAAYESCEYRTCTQVHRTRIVVGSSLYGRPVQVPGSFADGREWTGALSDTEKGERYSSRCTYRRVESVHSLYVRADWLTRVQSVGTGCVGEMLVLDAEACGFFPDLTPAYELRVVRQTAGTGLTVDTVTATATGGRWVLCSKKIEKGLTRMPAPILADYLEDRGAATADVMPLRAGYAS
jgi:hypothetical protein